MLPMAGGGVLERLTCSLTDQRLRKTVPRPTVWHGPMLTAMAVQRSGKGDAVGCLCPEKLALSLALLSSPVPLRVNSDRGGGQQMSYSAPCRQASGTHTDSV